MYEVSQDVNGPLLEMLAQVHMRQWLRWLSDLSSCSQLPQAINYEDAACIELFREGAPIVGELPLFHGGGERLLIKESFEPDNLLGRTEQINEKILTRLREDVHASTLHQACLDDALLGRMTEPELATPRHCIENVLSPRFSVEQGSRPRHVQQIFGNFSAWQGSSQMGLSRSGPLTI